MAKIKDLNERLADQTMRVTELETEYEHYRTRTQTEIIELRDKLDTMKEKLASQTNYESILNNMQEAQYNLAEKEIEIERVKEDFKAQIVKLHEEIARHSGTITVKDEYIKDLEEQNDDFRG